MSGCELAHEARHIAPRTISLLLTGYEDAPEVEAARADGTIFVIDAQ